ncbi:MAG: amidohydrolase [Steroidobacteraceae bacterium]|nr:amidohydrolase [Steroidobacteraceae bacterium]
MITAPEARAPGHAGAPASDLRLAVVQQTLAWGEPAANRAAFTKWLAPLAGATDLVLLPEMFTTGFSMEAARLAETMDGPSVAWLRETAARLGAVVAGSLIIDDDGCRNRFVWARPDGTLAWYDKRHLFRMAREHEHYVAGRERRVLEVRGWRVLAQVCYDLRFPVFARNRGDYDLAAYVANWPAARRYAWVTLLRARAIENLCFVAGVNRIGTDGRGIEYAGDTAVLDPLGAPLVDCGAAPAVTAVTLSSVALREHRTRFPAYLDADEFRLG